MPQLRGPFQSVVKGSLPSLLSKLKQWKKTNNIILVQLRSTKTTITVLVSSRKCKSVCGKLVILCVCVCERCLTVVLFSDVCRICISCGYLSAWCRNLSCLPLKPSNEVDIPRVGVCPNKRLLSKVTGELVEHLNQPISTL